MLPSTSDPDERPVELRPEQWAHITAAHPELAPHLSDILEAVRRPNRRMPGRLPGEEWFYLEGMGPSRWLKVVVHYERGLGRIITAFARRSMP